MPGGFLEELLQFLAGKGFHNVPEIQFGKFVRWNRDGKTSDKDCFIKAFDNGLTKSGKAFIGAHVGDWVTGEVYDWFSGMGTAWSQDEEREIKEIIIERAKINQAETDARHKEVALIAKEEVKSFATDRLPAYLIKKQISSLHGALVDGDDLIVVLRDINGQPWTFQRIKPNGLKLLRKDGKKKGNFHLINQPNNRDLSIILIAEGFSTAASIHEATLLPVVCAVDAGGLKPVAQVIREKFPNCQIIICADDDCYGKENRGKIDALKAAKEVFAQVVSPIFIDTKTKPTDFNDLHVLSGLNEVRLQILEQIESNQVETPELPEKPIPLALSDSFLAAQKYHFGNQTRLRYYKEDFYRYTGKKYQRFGSKNDDEIKSEINQWFKQIHRPEFCGNAKKINEMISLIKGHPVIVDGNYEMPLWVEGKKIRECKYLIPVQNGLIDMRKFATGGKVELLPHSPNFFCHYSLPFSYDPNARPVLYEKIADDIFSNQQEKDLWEEIMGAHLYQPFALEHFFVLQGEGRNGKSVLANILISILGRENISTIGLESFSSGGFMLHSTYGKLANIVADQNRVDKFNEGMLKQFVTREEMTFDRKFKEPITARPTAFLTILCNEAPKISDTTEGVARRMILFNFKKQIDSLRQDKRLIMPDFWQKSGELSGIFNLALAGLGRVVANNGFSVPANMAAEAEEHMLECNSIRQFVQEALIKEEDHTVLIPTHEVFDAFRWFLQRINSQEKPRRETFTKRLKQEIKRIPINAHVTQKASRSQSGSEVTKCWVGLRVKSGYSAKPKESTEPF